VARRLSFYYRYDEALSAVYFSIRLIGFSTYEKTWGIFLMSNEVTVDGAIYCSKVTINGTVLADKIMA
jgi:hypothetical protein